MEKSYPLVFQTDSEIVNEYYSNSNNYLIEYDQSQSKEYCVIYSSSNDLYYPNTEIAFQESIIKKNRFEWYGNRVKYAHKHIFLRDLKKQWYLSGINQNIDSHEKLFSFLKKEVEGYKVILLGSSAGGFNSILLGQLLGAERIYSFNGQFEISSLLKQSNENIDPLIFRNKDNHQLNLYFDTLNFIKEPSSIYYFHSLYNKWDSEQLAHVSNIQVNVVKFKTSNHGVPFLKSNLTKVLNMPVKDLNELVGKTFHPVTFSLKMVGIKDTIAGLSTIAKFVLNKIYIKTFQKLKQHN
jgi:hypothetical protein